MKLILVAESSESKNKNSDEDFTDANDDKLSKDVKDGKDVKKKTAQ